jgi:hypothetical protein
MAVPLHRVDLLDRRFIPIGDVELSRVDRPTWAIHNVRYPGAAATPGVPRTVPAGEGLCGHPGLNTDSLA